MPDAAEEAPGTSRLRQAWFRAGVRAALSIPLVREGQSWAPQRLPQHPRRVLPETLALLQTFADQSALAIHNARLFQELETKGLELGGPSTRASSWPP